MAWPGRRARSPGRPCVVLLLGVVVFFSAVLQKGGDAAPGPQHNVRLAPRNTHAALRLRGGGAAAWGEDEEDSLGGFAEHFVPSLTSREVVCVASVRASGHVCGCV